MSDARLQYVGFDRLLHVVRGAGEAAALELVAWKRGDEDDRRIRCPRRATTSAGVTPSSVGIDVGLIRSKRSRPRRNSASSPSSAANKSCPPPRALTKRSRVAASSSTTRMRRPLAPVRRRLMASRNAGGPFRLDLERSAGARPRRCRIASTRPRASGLLVPHSSIKARCVVSSRDRGPAAVGRRGSLRRSRPARGRGRAAGRARRSRLRAGARSEGEPYIERRFGGSDLPSDEIAAIGVDSAGERLSDPSRRVNAQTSRRLAIDADRVAVDRQHAGSVRLEYFAKAEERLPQALTGLIVAGVAPEQGREGITRGRLAVEREVRQQRLRLPRRNGQFRASWRSHFEGTEQGEMNPREQKGSRAENTSSLRE